MAIRDVKGRFVTADGYHNGREPNFDALEADGRVRRRWDFNDWTPGDWTYDEELDALRLTFNGEIVWKWDGRS